LVDLLVKTPRGLEGVAASRIEEEIEGVRVTVKPYGFTGLVLVEGVVDARTAVDLILSRIPEVERVLMVRREVESRLDEIVKAAVEVASSELKGCEAFAVRTTRRGKQEFTSVDVNVRVGAAIKEALNLDVDLETPSKVVYVEVVKDRTFICVEDGRVEWGFKKMKPGKREFHQLLRRISVAQKPYTGPLDAVRNMGIRIGRALQTFEVSELVVAPDGPVKGDEMRVFLQGLEEGIDSRYEVQRKAYSRSVVKVPVYVQDLYQLVRSRRGEHIIATSTRGESVSRVADKLDEVLKGNGRITVLIGAREGLPTGVFRFSSLVLDLSPGITISTDYACVAAIIALITHVEERSLKQIY